LKASVEMTEAFFISCDKCWHACSG
jgi:hypothetical protein